MLRRAASTFHDSQSGLVLTTPGSAGVRLHVLLDNPPDKYSLSPIPPQPWPTQPPGLPPYSLELPLAWLASARNLPTLPPGHRVYAPVASALELAELATLSQRRRFAAGDDAAAVLGVALYLPPCAMVGWLPLLEAAVIAELPTRVCLRYAWERAAGAHPDANAVLREVEDAVGRAADAGADAVVLSDSGGVATEESLREAVEACFSLDVAGDALMERLGVRVRGAVALAHALAQGLTRVDCEAAGGVGAWWTDGAVGVDEAVDAVTAAAVGKR